MPPPPTGAHSRRCHGCQFQADPSGDQWSTVSHPTAGTVTQCPECGSTDIRNVE